MEKTNPHLVKVKSDPFMSAPSWTWLAIGTALGAGVAQLLWFGEVEAARRFLTALFFLVPAPGIFIGKKWWAFVAVVAMAFMLIFLFCTLVPDYEVPIGERVNVSTAFLVLRMVIVSLYSFLMLRSLTSKVKPLFERPKR